MPILWCFIAKERAHIVCFFAKVAWYSHPFCSCICLLQMQPNFHSKISGVCVYTNAESDEKEVFKLLIFCKSLHKNLEMSTIKMHIPAILLWSTQTQSYSFLDQYICKVTNCNSNPIGNGNGPNKPNTINL